MSISTAIQNAQEKVRNAYTAVSDKGGAVPTVQNLNNLPEAINSISGGGGDSVEAWANGTAKNAQVGDKVVLNNIVAADTMLMDGVQASFSVDHGSSSGSPNQVPGGVISSDSYFTALNPRGTGLTNQVGVYGSRTSDTSWSIIKDTLSRPFGYSLLDPKRKICSVNGYSTRSKTELQLGLVSNGKFNTSFYFEDSYTTANGVTLCKDIFYHPLGRSGSGNRLLAIYSNGTITVISWPGISGSHFARLVSYYDGKYYFYTGAYNDTSCTERIYDPNTGSFSSTSYSVTGLPPLSSDATYLYDRVFLRYLGDFSGKYFIVKSTNSSVQIYERISGHPGANQTYAARADLSAIFSKINNSALICNDVQIDPSTGYTYIYVADYYANQVFARFKDGVIEELPPPFDKDIVHTMSAAAMNWNDGLFMCSSLYPNASGSNPLTVYVKSTDVIAPFEYCANSFADRYVVSDSITGFVSDKRNAFDGTILTVDTVKDPRKEPWSDIGKLYGFDVKVTKGD